MRRLEHKPVAVTLKSSPLRDPVRAVLRAAKYHDLVVLGLQGSFLNQVGMPTVPEQISRQCAKPMVLVKASKGLRALTKKWL